MGNYITRLITSEIVQWDPAENGPCYLEFTAESSFLKPALTKAVTSWHPLLSTVGHASLLCGCWRTAFRTIKPSFLSHGSVLSLSANPLGEGELVLNNNKDNTVYV